MAEYNRLAHHILPDDLNLATHLAKCMEYSLHRMIHAPDTEEFEKWHVEFNRCSQDFKELTERKERHDQMVRIAQKYQRQGVKAEVVNRVQYIALEEVR